MADNQLNIKHTYRAPIDQIFDAWVDGEGLKQWHAPGNTPIPKAMSENHEGGNRAVSMKINDSLTVELKGTYSVFDKPNKLVYTWNPTGTDQKTTVTVIFTALGDNKTEVDVTQVLADAKDTKDARDGWAGILERLEDYVG